jgi:TetR/AcrR family transcriptional repressor of nem operon
MPKIVDKKEKAARIGSAAIAVFRSRGYHATRMADIAEAAGTGKGTLYEYFRNKEDIFRLEFERYFAVFESGARAAMAEADSPGQRLLALVRFAFDHVREWEDHCAVYVDYFGSAHREDDSVFSLSAIYAEMEDVIRTLIEAGQAAGEVDESLDPDATAELLVSLFDGVVLHGVFVERRAKPDSVLDAATRLLTSGLFAGPPPHSQKAVGGARSGERTQ